MTMRALDIQHLSHYYNDLCILDDISLQVYSDEFVCLSGPSGCGKTTLLRLISGLEHVQTGSICAHNRTVSAQGIHVPPSEREIGFVFQDASLFPHLTVKQNVMFGLHHFSVKARGERAEEMLDQVSLLVHKDSYPHMLSGGQQQRVSLARSLAPEPQMLLLDEPFTNLDRDLRRRVRNDTLALLKKNKVTALMVTHEPYEAMLMADRIILLDDDGHVHQEGSPHELYHHPKDSFSALYFGDTNHFEIALEAGIANTPLGEIYFANDITGHALMVVRPEDIHITTEKTQSISGVVEHTKCVGAECEVLVRLDNHQTVMVRPRGKHHGEIGERLYLHIVPESCHLFFD